MKGVDRQDSLRADVEAIALPEGRMIGGTGHARARAYLERRLTEIGLDHRRPLRQHHRRPQRGR